MSLHPRHECESKIGNLKSKMFGCGIDVFISAAGTIHNDDFFARHSWRCLEYVSDGMGSFERGNDPFGFGKHAESIECLIVRGVSVFDATEVAKVGMFRANRSVIESGGH